VKPVTLRRFLPWVLIPGVMSVALWIQQDLDRHIVISHNIVYEIPVLRLFFDLLSDYGIGCIAFVYTVYLLWPEFRTDHQFDRILFLGILLSLGIGAAGSSLLKLVFTRERPIIDLGEMIRLTYVSGTYSFPSGHATQSLSLALPFGFFSSDQRVSGRLTCLLTALIASGVSYSRIALQRHYPGDVLAGLALAVLSSLAGRWMAIRWFSGVLPDFSKERRLQRMWAIIYLILAVGLWIR